MYYYNLYDEQEKFLGVISSSHLRYFNPKNKLILCCNEEKAQYASLNNKIYLVEWFRPESEELKGEYPLAILGLTTREEYEKYIAEQNEKIESEISKTHF